MKSVLFIIPLKKGCIDQYKSILKQAVRRKKSIVIVLGAMTYAALKHGSNHLMEKIMRIFIMMSAKIFKKSLKDLVIQPTLLIDGLESFL